LEVLLNQCEYSQVSTPHAVPNPAGPPALHAGNASGKSASKSGALKPILLTVLACGLLILGFRFWITARTWETTDNAVVVGTAHQISSRISGTISEVLVVDHQPVKAGQVLLKMDDADEQAALTRTRASLAQADAQIALARANASRAKADYDRAAELIKSRVFSIADIDSARAAKDAAAAALSVAEAGWDVANAALHEAELQVSYTVVKSPADGRIGAKAVQTGNRIFPGQPLMAVVEEFSWVVANFKETQVAKMAHGQEVKVHVDALNGITLPARLESVSPASGAVFALLPPDNATGNFTKVVQRVPVKIYFDEAAVKAFRDKLLPGLSVTAEVNIRAPEDPPIINVTR